MHELKTPREAEQYILDSAIGTLKGGADASACTSFIAKADRRFAATLDQLCKKGAPIACKAGCSFCCHLRVTVTPPEGIALSSFLKTEIPAPLAQDIERRVLANADRVAQMTDAQRLATNMQCAFLVDRKCAAYRARPMACALHHSLDVDACQALYENPADDSIGIRKLKWIEGIMTATRSALKQALGKLGLSDAPMELHTAVAAVLRDQSRIAQWQSGHALLDAPAPGVAPASRTGIRPQER